MAQAYKVIGTKVERVDGLERLIGEAKYASDIYLPGMLYAKFLRSQHPSCKGRQGQYIAGTDPPRSEARSDGGGCPWRKDPRETVRSYCAYAGPRGDGQICGRRDPGRSRRG